MPPVGSDHSAQLVKLFVDKENTDVRLCQRVGYEQLGKLLIQHDNTTIFIGCIDVDDFASRFNETAERRICLLFLQACLWTTTASKTFRAIVTSLTEEMVSNKAVK